MTTEEQGGIIVKLSARNGKGHRKDLEKNFKKSLKKVLTREKRCGIIVKLSPKRETEDKRSLKIEQQERSTKHSIVRNTNLVKRVYIYSNKVREAKINSSKTGYNREIGYDIIFSRV